MARNKNWNCGRCQCGSSNLTVIDGNGWGCVDCGRVFSPGYVCQCDECRTMRLRNPAGLNLARRGRRERV